MKLHWRMNSDHVFLIHTPYHLLLALSIIRAENISQPVFVFIKEISGWAKYREHVRALFPEILTLSVPGRLVSFNSKFLRILNMVLASYLLRMMVYFFRPMSLYIFNDDRPDIRAAAVSCRRLRGSVILVEDGTALYVASKTSKSFHGTRIQRVIKNLLYGVNFSSFGLHGLSDEISEYRAVFPPLVRSDIKSRGLPVKQIHVSALLPDARIAEFSKKICLSFGESSLDSESCVLLLAENSLLVSNLATTLDTISKSLENRQNLRLLVKFHPDERNVRYIDGVSQMAARVVTKELGSEFFILANFSSIVEIYGGLSTSLMLARAILPNTKIFATNSDLLDFKKICSSLQIGVRG